MIDNAPKNNHGTGEAARGRLSPSVLGLMMESAVSRRRLLLCGRAALLNVVSPIWKRVTVYAETMMVAAAAVVVRTAIGYWSGTGWFGGRTKYPLDLVINELRAIF